MDARGEVFIERVSSVLAWSSNVDGSLGIGETLLVTGLTLGQHTILLTVLDRQGASGSRSITITIVKPPAVYLPVVVSTD